MMKIKNTLPYLTGALLLLAQMSFGQITNGDFSDPGPSLPTTEVADEWFVNSAHYTVSTFAGSSRIVYATGTFLGMNNGSPFIGVDGLNTNPNGSGAALEIFQQSGVSVRSTANTLTFDAASRSSTPVTIEIWLNNTMLGSRTINSLAFSSFSVPVSGQVAGPNNVVSIRQASFNTNGFNDFGIDNINIPCGDCEAGAGIEVEDECNPIQFIASGASTNYLWDFGDGHTSNFANPVHQYADAGTYTITLVSYISDGCGTCCDVTSITIDVECGEFTGEAMTWGSLPAERTGSINGGSMDHNLMEDLNVYPNPTSDLLNISFMLQQTENVNLEVYSSTGKLVSTIMNNKTSNEGTVNLSLETESLPAGVYHLVMSTSNGKKTKSFVVSD